MAAEMIFIDTGAFYARYRQTDDCHEAAVRGWSELESTGLPAVTTHLIIAESANLLGHLLGTVRAAERVRHWLDSRKLAILRPGVAEEQAAADLMEKFGDQNIGFVDCVSIVVMRQRHIHRVFGFDRHFTVAGFELWPKP